MLALLQEMRHAVRLTRRNPGLSFRCRAVHRSRGLPARPPRIPRWPARSATLWM